MLESPPGSVTGTGIHGRNEGLDLARAAAITLVVGSHIASYGFSPGGYVGSLVDLAGGLGVELFFSLSGFLIGRILLRLADDVRPGSVAVFLGRRWLRTLPLYYAVLAVSCWIFRRVDWPGFFFLQSMWPGEASLVPQSWSLVLEEFFYLTFPLLMLAATRRFGTGARLVWRVAWLLIAAAWIARLSLPFDAHNHPLMRLDCAAYGVAAACLEARRRRPPVGGLRLAGGATVLVTLVYVALAWWPLSGVLGRLASVAAWPTFNAAFALLVWALFYAVRRLPAGVGVLSRLSYSIYLVHLLLLAFVMRPLLDAAGEGFGVVALCAAILVCAAVTWVLIEQPFLLLRKVLF